MGKTYGCERKYCKHCSRFIDDKVRKAYYKGYSKAKRVTEAKWKAYNR